MKKLILILSVVCLFGCKKEETTPEVKIMNFNIKCSNCMITFGEGTSAFPYSFNIVKDSLSINRIQSTNSFENVEITTSTAPVGFSLIVKVNGQIKNTMSGLVSFGNPFNQYIPY